MREISEVKIDMKSKRNITKVMSASMVAVLLSISLSACFGGDGDEVGEEQQPEASEQTPSVDVASNFFSNIPAFPLRTMNESRAYFMVKNIYDKYMELVVASTGEDISDINEIETSFSMQENILERACTLRDGANDNHNDIVTALEDFSSNSTDLEYYQFSFLVWASFSFEYEHVIIQDNEGNIEEYDPSRPNFKDLCHK